MVACLKNSVKKRKPFKPGDTVVFDPSKLGRAYWRSLSENERKRYYGTLGYGSKGLHLFTFLCEHRPQAGHCVLISMQDQHIETMRHTAEFRLATEDET